MLCSSWERCGADKDRDSRMGLSALNSKDVSIWRDEESNNTSPISFYFPATRADTQWEEKGLHWGNSSVPQTSAAHHCAPALEQVESSYPPPFMRTTAPPAAPAIKTMMHAPNPIQHVVETQPLLPESLAPVNVYVNVNSRECPLLRNCKNIDCPLTHSFGRDIIDAAFNTLIQCGVLVPKTQLGAQGHVKPSIYSYVPHVKPSISSASHVLAPQAFLDPHSHCPRVPSSEKRSANPFSFSAMSMQSSDGSDRLSTPSPDFELHDMEFEEPPKSTLDCCIKVLTKAGGEASVWFMGEVYKRMPQARDEVASFGGLKNFCAAYPDVLGYKTGTEDKDRVCLAPKYLHLLSCSSPTNQPINANVANLSPPAKGCRYGKYCARIYCKFKHSKDRDAPGLREGFIEMCTRHLNEQGGTDLSSNLMNAIYREEPKAKDEIARLVRKWGGLKGFCQDMPGYLEYHHDEVGSRHSVSLIEKRHFIDAACVQVA